MPIMPNVYIHMYILAENIESAAWCLHYTNELVHAHKFVLLQMFYQAISNSKIKVSLHAMKVEVNIKELCQQLFKYI